MMTTIEQNSALFLLAAVNGVLNGLVVLVIFLQTRRKELRYLCYYVTGSIFTFIIQYEAMSYGVLNGAAIAISFFLMAVPLGYFIDAITNYRAPGRLYFFCFAIGASSTLLIQQLAGDTYVAALPIILGAGFPYAHSMIFHVGQFRGFTLAGKLLYFTCMALFLFLESVPLLLKTGSFMSAGVPMELFLIFLQTIFGLLLAIEISTLKEKRKLEHIVEDRTKLLVVKNKEILDQQASIERKNKELLLLNEEKNNLIGIVAHDLKSPLGRIEGLLNLISMENGDVDDALVTTAKDIICTQRTMINRILDIQAIEASIIHIEKIDVEVVHLVKAIMKSHEKPAALKNISLILQTTDARIVHYTNQGYLVMILENLLSNAVKFSPFGLQIIVRLRRMDIMGELLYRIEVADEGPGIPDHELGLLFKKFQRLSTRPTGGEESTGLGLAIARKYCDLLGGRIWCEQNLTSGSTFIVEFTF